MKKIEQGFSLIELLVVVAIIGILAAVGTVGYGNYIESTKKKVTEANVTQIATAFRTAAQSQGAVTPAQVITDSAGIKNSYDNSSAYSAVAITDCSLSGNAGKIWVDNAAAPTVVRGCNGKAAGDIFEVPI